MLPRIIACFRVKQLLLWPLLRSLPAQQSRVLNCVLTADQQSDKLKMGFCFASNGKKT